MKLVNTVTTGGRGGEMTEFGWGLTLALGIGVLAMGPAHAQTQGRISRPPVKVEVVIPQDLWAFGEKDLWIPVVDELAQHLYYARQRFQQGQAPQSPHPRSHLALPARRTPPPACRRRSPR